jgi:hypothetical protein
MVPDTRYWILDARKQQDRIFHFFLIFFKFFKFLQKFTNFYKFFQKFLKIFKILQMLLTFFFVWILEIRFLCKNEVFKFFTARVTEKTEDRRDNDAQINACLRCASSCQTGDSQPGVLGRGKALTKVMCLPIACARKS